MREEKARKIMATLKKLSSDALGLNDLRMVVALERAVARIETVQVLANAIIFKGGFVLLKTTNSIRFTRDIDALAKNIRQEKVIAHIRDALNFDLQDGVWYGDIKTRELGRELPYPGVRFDAAFQIGDPPTDDRKIKKLSRIHLDVGFGDYIPTHKREVMRSVLPDSDPVSWSVYPLEQIVAEKLHALVLREAGNSRAKDIYDLVLLFRNEALDKTALPKLVEGTFQARQTELPHPIYRDIQTMDLTILRSAWRSLEIMGTPVDFEVFWTELMNHLRKLEW